MMNDRRRMKSDALAIAAAALGTRFGLECYMKSYCDENGEKYGCYYIMTRDDVGCIDISIFERYCLIDTDGLRLMMGFSKNGVNLGNVIININLNLNPDDDGFVTHEIMLTSNACIDVQKPLEMYGDIISYFTTLGHVIARYLYYMYIDTNTNANDTELQEVKTESSVDGELNPDDYNIKMDGEQATFEGGAIRYKKNKGRFDLIPADATSAILETFYYNYLKNNRCTDIDMASILQLANIFDDVDEDAIGPHGLCLINLIIDLTVYHYGYKEERETGKLINVPNRPYTLNDITLFCEMLQELAIHFQKGAEKYGERNCQQGIPLWSFIDSGRRHLTQYLTGQTDEPHHISAIWNFYMALWTLLQMENEECDKCDDCDCCDDGKEDTPTENLVHPSNDDKEMRNLINELAEIIKAKKSDLEK